MKTKKRSIPYETGPYERLRDPEIAKYYIAESLAGDPEESIPTFLLALRDVASAHGMTELSEEIGINRVSLYKALSGEGNPTLDTLNKILAKLGLKLSIEELGRKHG